MEMARYSNRCGYRHSSDCFLLARILNEVGRFEGSINARGAITMTEEWREKAVFKSWSCSAG